MVMIILSGFSSTTLLFVRKMLEISLFNIGMKAEQEGRVVAALYTEYYTGHYVCTMMGTRTYVCSCTVVPIVWLERNHLRPYISFGRMPLEDLWSWNDVVSAERSFK